MVIKYLLLILIQSLVTFALPFTSRNDPKAEYLVTYLPGLYLNLRKDQRPLMFSGQLELYPENKTHYFFWKYQDTKKIPEAEKRTIFWLNGGPGCSSMDGALMEAGPFRVNKEMEVIYNEGSWHKSGDIVFVDQPAGTGFSYSDEYDHDLDQITIEFLKFMEKYYELFPDDASNEIYFAGESYAGQYIPYIADGILRRNKNLQEGEKPYNLKGLLIGNGWIAPNEQSLSYLPYSVQAGIIKTSNPRWSLILSQHQECQKIVSNNDGPDGSNELEVVSNTCERVLNLILDATRDRLAANDQQCINMYDYTLKDSYPSCGMNWPPDLANITPFLREQSVMNDLNLINHKEWNECSGKVGRYFKAKNSKPSIHLFPSILEEIPVVLFNGNRDIICNYIGTEEFIKKLTWNGQTGFSEDVDAMDWIYDEKKAGYIKTERNLTFVNIFDASHMVPFDKPEISRSLIDLITGNFDEKEVDNKSDKKKKSIVTYPLGVRKAKQQEDSKPKTTLTSSKQSKTSSASAVSGRISATSTTAAQHSALPSAEAEVADNQRTSSRITRIIQFIVIVVLIWGVYILYSSYKSRPSSIIKTGPSGKKKNVQWADQLRQFEEEEIEQNEQGILSRAFNKLKGGDNRGAYAPTSGKAYEDIEMSGGVNEHTDNGVENFIIESDEEDVNEDNQNSKQLTST
mmetsp:Transcript_8947/g.11174  ORF Transcript_8947/g.11174 Transcript_8947/m.11174 type:complete len:684 (-) Transcript_8947:8490-10541(-)